MSKNMTRRGLAFGAGLSLVATGLASAPAQAAAGDLVSLVPSAGLKYGTFISDTFTLESFSSSQLSTTQKAIRIDNPDQDVLHITLKEDDTAPLNGTYNDVPLEVDVYGITSSGVYRAISLDQQIDGPGAGQVDGEFVVDMDAAGIVSLIVTGIEGFGSSSALEVAIKPLAKVSGGKRESATFTDVSLQATREYTLTSNVGSAVTFTTDATPTVSELASGLDAAAGADEDQVVVRAVDGDLIVGYQDAGNKTNATLTLAETVTTDDEGDTTDNEEESVTLTVINGATYTLVADPGGSNEDTITFTADATATAAEIAAGLAASQTHVVITEASGVLDIAANDNDSRATSTLTISLPVTVVDGAATGDVDFTLLNGVLDFDNGADTAVALAYGAGDKTVTVTSWVESEAVADYETVDTNYASLTRTVTWYDPKGVVVVPRIERIIQTSTNNLNDVGNAMVTSIQFNKDINLAQFDKSQWTEQVTTTGLPAFGSDSDVHGTALIPSGLGTNPDNFDRYAFNPASFGNVAVDTTYTLNVHSKLAETASVTRWFSSTGYSIGNGSTLGTAEVFVPLITDTADVDYTAVTDTTGADAFATASIRAGVNAVTYTGQFQSVLGTNSKTASVPMLAIVRAGSFVPSGSSFTVSGNASAITKAGEARMVTGFTDANGRFSVTVTSAVAAKNESYTVDFFVLVDGAFQNVIDTATGNDTSRITATYSAADAGASSLTADSDVVAGANPVVGFSITDQFGTAISKTAAGKQLYVSLVAPNKDNLEKTAEVVNGEVSFTFANYLDVGGSDLLTATLYTGTASDPTTVDTAVVTLYNTGATGAVQVPTTLNGQITYFDFIANGAKAVAGVTPAPDNGIIYTGTVVDANGVGIPAAVVTIDAPGMSILDGTRYYDETRTTNANAAGVFTVTLYAHKVDTTGVAVTATTADGKSASTVVKTYLPEDGDPNTAGTQTLGGSVLNFDLEMPANIVMNQTYAVKARLTDKWGNPIQTSSATNAVKFLGVGSIQVNGVSTPVERQFDKNGEALVYVRSVKDIAGPGTLTAELQTGEYTYWNGSATATKDIAFGELTTDVVTTAWDETKFVNSFSKDVEVLETAPAATTEQKVNAGSFKGYVAVYARGYEGSRLSAKIGDDWVVVPSIVNNQENGTLFRVTDFTGAGVNISVRIYIDRVLMATIPLVTK